VVHIPTMLTIIPRHADHLFLCFALYMEHADHIDPWTNKGKKGKNLRKVSKINIFRKKSLS
jgi:hypothetical protein